MFRCILRIIRRLFRHVYFLLHLHWIVQDLISIPIPLLGSLHPLAKLAQHSVLILLQKVPCLLWSVQCGLLADFDLLPLRNNFPLLILCLLKSAFGHYKALLEAIVRTHSIVCAFNLGFLLKSRLNWVLQITVPLHLPICLCLWVTLDKHLTSIFHWYWIIVLNHHLSLGPRHSISWQYLLV